MKITAANIYLFDTGSREIGAIKPVFVELVTDQGITGIGEAGAAYCSGYSATAAMIREIVESYVIGRDPFDIRAIYGDFYSNSFWAKGGGTVIFGGISAVETALWDIMGKALNVPLYQLLGGKVRERIHIYANWSMSHPLPTPTDFARRAEEVVADGYDAIKMYPLNHYNARTNSVEFIQNREVDRQTERRCVQIIKSVREAVGDDVEITVDMCGDATVDVITRIGRAVEECGLYFFEEPIDAFDSEGFKLLGEKLNVPLAAGERLYTLTAFRRLLETRGLAFVQPDPGLVGGILETVKVASLAETYEVRVLPHNSGGPILTAACLQLDACLPNFGMQEVFPYRPAIFYDIVDRAPELEIKDSYWQVGNRPGLGVNLNHKVVDKYRIYNCSAK